MSGGEFKVCVVYHYFEKNEEYRRNLSHFLKFGIIEGVTYHIVISGTCTLSLPEISNVSYWYEGNHNYDYGGHSLVVERIQYSFVFDFYVFLNCSVRGPFLPPWRTREEDWLSPFLMHFEDDSVGIVGTSINILPKSSPHASFYKSRHGGSGPFAHVQSMAFVLKKETFFYLVGQGFFGSAIALSRKEIISDYEIRLSQLILDGNWKIKCLLPEYNVIDYRTDVCEVNPTAVNGDVNYPAAYFGRSVHPYEVIFIKTARAIWPISYLDALAYSMAVSNGAVDDLCYQLDVAHISNGNAFFNKLRSKVKSFLNFSKAD